MEWVTLPGSRIGILRRFGVYLPPGYDQDLGREYPVLYLLRGHEAEWAGCQDGREGLTTVIDRMIGAREVSPLIAVLPGFMAPDRRSQGVPVNWSADPRPRGCGNGRHEDHFLEVVDEVEDRYRVRTDRAGRAIDGFSMGGYAAILMATRHPHLFGSAGAYDGSFMWPGQIDPRRPPHGRSCRLWLSEACAPYFQRDDGRWDRAKMEAHNPLTIMATARARRLNSFRSMRWHIRCAAHERDGNVDRARALVAGLRTIGCVNSWADEDLRLDPAARHSWMWADRHLEANLPLHDEVFRGA